MKTHVTVLLLFLLETAFSQKQPNYVERLEIKAKKIILEPGDNYTLNELHLTSPDTSKRCVLFNMFSNNWQDITQVYNRALVVIKVFLDKPLENSLVEVNPDTLKQKQQPPELLALASSVLASHLQLKVTTMLQQGGQESTLSDFTAVIKRGTKYYLIKGEAVCQFFYILDYDQTSIFQSNLTIINTRAIIDSHLYQRFDNNHDSLPFAPRSAITSKVDIQGKIFLIGKGADGSFRFYRKPISASEGSLYRSIEEFDYTPGIGIISFACRVPLWLPTGELTETNEYYRFSSGNTPGKLF